MLGICAGKILAPDSGDLTFRLLDGPRHDTFEKYVQMFSEASAPVAIVWPMRVAGGIATTTHQSRFLAMAVKLPGARRFAVKDPQRPMEWLIIGSPRVSQILRCLNEFGPNENAMEIPAGGWRVVP